MSRFFMGIKPGVGPVIKIMADPAYDPITTPNTDWQKFIVNSEVQEVAYGDAVGNQSFPTASYSWAASPGIDYYYPSAGGNWIWHAITLSNVNGQYLQLYINPINIFDANAFHFITRDANSWLYNWCQRRLNYPAANNVSGNNFTVMQRYYPWYRMIFRYHSSTGVWTMHSILPNWNKTYLDFAALWPSGLVGQSNPDTSGPNPSGYYQNLDLKFTAYQLELPIDNSPYPADPGFTIPGQKVLELNNSTFRMARPGYDVRTASQKQLLFSSDRIPLKVIKTGSLTLPSGSIQSVNLGATYSPSILVDYQVNITGQSLYLPPHEVVNSDAMQCQYRINGQNLEFRNISNRSLDIRYFVMSEDDLSPSTGSAKVFEKTLDGDVIIRRPNTTGQRLNDVIINSKFPVMQIVSQGWIPFSSMTTSDNTVLGSHMATVSFANSGFKPYVLARIGRRNKSDTSIYEYYDFWAKKSNHMSTMSDSSFVAQITDTQVKFYCSDGSRLEDQYRETPNPQSIVNIPSDFTTHGIRYYIFAVPVSL